MTFFFVLLKGIEKFDFLPCPVAAIEEMFGCHIDQYAKVNIYLGQIEFSIKSESLIGPFQ